MAELRADGQLEVTVDVTNAGARLGETVLFLFIRDPVASVARPVLELKRFARIGLAASAREGVRWLLPTSELSFLGPDLVPTLEPGEFAILVGESAAPETLLSAKVRLVM